MQKDAPERNCCISFPQPWHIISTHHGIGFWVLRGIFSDSPEHLFKLSGASFCLRARVPYYIFKFRMLRRYRKIKEDSRYSAAEDRGQYSVSSDSAAKLMSFIFFYLLLSPSISFYLQGKQSLRKLNYIFKTEGDRNRVRCWHRNKKQRGDACTSPEIGMIYIILRLQGM